MFCGVSNLDASIFLGFIEKPFLIGISLTLPGSRCLVSLIMALAKVACRGLSPSKLMYTIRWLLDLLFVALH